MRTSSYFLILSILLAGCSTGVLDGEEDKCSGTVQREDGTHGYASGRLFTGITDREVSDRVTVKGTIDRGAGVTVYAVSVGGVPAMNNGLDFESFSADLSFDVLTNLSVAAGTPNAAPIDLHVRTNCGEVALGEQGVIKLAPRMGLDVENLAFGTPIIEGGNFLPANRSVAAILKLTASPRSAGKTVHLVTTAGKFDNGASSIDKTLSGDSATDAHAEVALNGYGAAGVATVTAEANGNASASTTVLIAGPPTLDPSARSVDPGETIEVTVTSDGDIHECTANSSTFITVGGLSSVTSKRAKLTVFASNNAPANTRATITCTDSQGQPATGTYTVATPVPLVNTLSITNAYPNGKSFIPANGRDVSTLTLHANAEARGAQIEVRTTLGNIDGTRSRTVTLAGDGVQPIAQDLYLSSTEVGRAIVVASAINGRTSSVDVLIAGAPVLSPASQTLQAGQTIAVSARSEGDIVSCSATSSPGFQVSSSAVNNQEFAVTVTAVSPPVTGALTAITCRDSYGQTSSPANFQVSGASQVAQLSFDPPIIPGNAGYLPADGHTPAVLRVAANPGAAGALVHVVASFGLVDGLAQRDVFLSGNGVGAAEASLLYTASSAGTAIITAAAGGMTVVTSVRVAGRPSLLPGTMTLSAGQSFRVSVVTEGTIDTCQASPAAGLTVTSGGLDLMAAPQPLSGDIVVSAAAVISGPAQTTITCRDLFGQSGTGQYGVQ